MIDDGKPMPEYFKNHPIYYAGPAKTPEGMPSGSFGPTTAGRMDSYVDLFQSLGASLIMVAKGNRNRSVIDACKKYGALMMAKPLEQSHFQFQTDTALRFILLGTTHGQ
jgi:fumarate hydratase class I